MVVVLSVVVVDSVVVVLSVVVVDSVVGCCIPLLLYFQLL